VLRWKGLKGVEEERFERWKGLKGLRWKREFENFS